MSPPNIEIRHGRFIDIDGPSRTFDGITFAAARVELLGNGFSQVCELQEHLMHVGVSAELKAFVTSSDDATWVRGRAQRLFLVPNTTENERPEKSFFFATFIALLQDGDGRYLGVPFQCSDYYAHTGLTFSSEDSPPESMQKAIAAAFWELLMSNPTDVDEYRDTMYHHGVGVEFEFGIENGASFIDELEEED